MLVEVKAISLSDLIAEMLPDCSAGIHAVPILGIGICWCVWDRLQLSLEI